MNYEYKDILSVLSESTIDEIFDFELFNEDGKESKDGKFKKFVDGASKKYVDGLNKRSETFAKMVTKKPGADATPDIVEKYEKKVLQARTTYKIGEILASKTVLLGPLDMIATAVIIKGITNSNDPTDKMVVEKLNMLKAKAEALKEKLSKLADKNKNKPVSAEDKEQYDAGLLQGENIANDIAKEIDATKAKFRKPSTVTESVLINKFDEYLLKEDGSLVDNAYEILSTIVEKTDYTKYDIYPVVEHYIDMMI